MAEKKVTTMVLKVDLQCPSCYRKIKKVLAKFPQIRSRAYDEKQNTVTITVVCCSPEKIRDKLRCKGGKTIKIVEIKPPPKLEEPDNTKEAEKSEPPSPATEKSEPPPPATEKSEPPPPATEMHNSPPPSPGPPVYVPVPVCCGQCYEGIPGGPCYEGCRRPVPYYDGYGYGGNRACYGVSRCDEYFNKENTSGCTIM